MPDAQPQWIRIGSQLILHCIHVMGDISPEFFPLAAFGETKSLLIDFDAFHVLYHPNKAFLVGIRDEVRNALIEKRIDAEKRHDTLHPPLLVHRECELESFQLCTKPVIPEISADEPEAYQHNWNDDSKKGLYFFVGWTGPGSCILTRVYSPQMVPSYYDKINIAKISLENHRNNDDMFGSFTHAAENGTDLLCTFQRKLPDRIGSRECHWWWKETSYTSRELNCRIKHDDSLTVAYICRFRGTVPIDQRAILEQFLVGCLDYEVKGAVELSYLHVAFEIMPLDKKWQLIPKDTHCRTSRINAVITY